MASLAPLGGLLSSSDVGSVNRSRILQSLIDDGPASRADLARRLRVPRASIGAIVASLLSAGVLEEYPSVPPADGIGKPARPLWFDRQNSLCGAVAVSRRSVEVAVVNAAGEIVTRAQSVIVPGPTGPLEEQILAAARSALAPYRAQLRGIGLTVPALVDAESMQVIACTPVPGLVGTTLPARLAEAFGAPTLLEQDVRALAVGEKWFGVARGIRDFAALQIGVGVGAGIVLGGRLLTGSGAHSAQLGHTCVQMDGLRCSCGLRGCWETLASSRWLRATCAARGIPGGRQTTPRRLARRARDGDRTAAQVLDEYADNLAVGISTLVQLLSLDLFILHGEVIHAGEAMRERIQRRVTARSMPELAGRVRVAFSALDQDSALLGAAATVLSRQLGLAQ